MTSNPYITDILSQPAALRLALDHYPSGQIEELKSRLEKGEFSRIILTGMGSSYNAAYPAWLNLAGLSIPSIHVNTAELLHYAGPLVDSRTLLWMNSQSGRSVEIVRLLEMLKDRRPAFQLSLSNYPDSPLAQNADLPVSIHAGDEATVSTKTFVNMLALLSLASAQLAGQDWRSQLASMRSAADGMEAYLSTWQDRVAELDTLLTGLDQLLILGRGPSMGAVWNGSLINKEAAKCVFEGLNVADFRHGPMELASDRLTLFVLEGVSQTASINRELALEVKRLGGRIFWLSTRSDPELTTLALPAVADAARPLVEILPFQMLSILMARRNGLEPGKFRHIGKVTLQE
ncbi:MAG TPA: SIS domain-containing protein [Anaerolineales bacterium]|jgi:glucosamine--fructose-6-phosphate aminotransferase (isomerizing)